MKYRLEDLVTLAVVITLGVAVGLTAFYYLIVPWLGVPHTLT